MEKYKELIQQMFKQGHTPSEVFQACDQLVPKTNPWTMNNTSIMIIDLIERYERTDKREST
jgi:hypothetical protein